LPSSAELEALIVAVSKVFADYPGVEDSSVSASARTLTRSVVSSEGVVSREPSTLIEFQLQCSAQAKDGMPLVHTVSSFGVPSEAQLSERARALASGLIETANAELASDSFGPVLFTDVAAAQIAHELLAMNLAGTPDGEELQGPFARRLGKRVLPDDFDAFDDPGLEHYRGLALAGHYLMDDEGVRAQRVSLVEKGRLASFLMSRTPNRVIGASNGHGRSGLSGWARGMVGNLIVETRKGATRATLEKRLLAAARDQRAEFGIVIERLAERAFATGGASPPVPERAYKLYADGRRVPIRGAELGEINVRELRSLLGSGDHPNVYNYVVTWPSGLASPSSVVAPDLLFEEVELTKTKRSYRRPKLLPRPN
jgi:hypothetical protein